MQPMYVNLQPNLPLANPVLTALHLDITGTLRLVLRPAASMIFWRNLEWFPPSKLEVQTLIYKIRDLVMKASSPTHAAYLLLLPV